MSSLFADDLPRPSLGKLVVYLLGPGVGESLVVVFPDGRCMVIDGCERDGINLPAALLAHLDVTSVEAVALTHPDLDHLRGMATVVQRFRPRRIFRYPADAYLRDLVAVWVEKSPQNTRYRHLAEAIRTIDEHARLDTTDIDEVCATTRAWTPEGAPYTVHFLAPTHFDRERVRVLWRKLVEYKSGRFRLSKRFERLLNGDARLGDAPNAVSLAVVLEWAGRKVLLAGDVDNGKRSSKSGWKGVLRILDDPDAPRSNLVEDVELVKVAHHGSKGAFFTGVWTRHTKSRKTTAILTPFAPSPLPSDRTLVELRAHCDRIGISAGAGDAFVRAQAAGWTPAPSAVPATPAPCVAAVLDDVGRVELFRGAAAGIFN